jgi:hypothetical protein
VARRDHQRFAKSQGVEIRGHDVRIEPLAFVERQRHRFARAAQLPGDEMVLGVQSRTRIGEEDQAVGLGDGALGLRPHLRGQPDRVFHQTAGVDEDTRHRT